MKALYYKRVRGHCAPEIKGMWHHFYSLQLEFLRALFGINSTKPELSRIVPRAFILSSQTTGRMNNYLTIFLQLSLNAPSIVPLLPLGFAVNKGSP